MAVLSERKRFAISALIDQAPDALLYSIEAAFQNQPGPGATLVREAAERARVERAARMLAFEPLMPLFRPRADGVQAPFFPLSCLKAVWAELARRRADALALLAARIRAGETDAPNLMVVDGLCAEAAAVLRGGDPADWRLADEAQAEELAAYFDLAPMARQVVARLPDWLGRMDEARATALRLAFRDAAGLRDDGAPRLMEILMAHLADAGAVMRIVAVVTDGAKDTFIQSSELASFGERLLRRLEEQSADLAARARRADPAEARAAVAVMEAVAGVLAEFDLSIPSDRAGPWGSRLAAVRRKIGEHLEAVLRGAEKLATRALPLSTAKLAGRMSRQAPDLSADPRSKAVDEARAALILLAGSRAMAAVMGCESLRRQTAEAVAERVDAYAEEGLQMLHAGEASDPGRALDLIEVAAEFLGLSRSEEAAALVRRRAAVALQARDDGDETAQSAA